MRDMARISPFLEEISKEWERVPDWRFGQLIVNFISYYGDPFYLEDDAFIDELKRYLDVQLLDC